MDPGPVHGTYAGLMQPTTPRVTARRLGLDAALILVLAGASLVWGNAMFFDSPLHGKILKDVGMNVEMWPYHVLWWWLAAPVAAAAIVLRHWWPLAATLLAAGSAGAHWLDGLMPHLPMDIAVLVTMYTLAGTVRSRRTAITVLVTIEAALYALCLAMSPGPVAPGDELGGRIPTGSVWETSPLLAAAKEAALPGLLLAVAWAVADSARTRRAHLATLRARAEDLEREQGQRTALAVAAERGRITRELHDVVAHSLSVIVVQAQGAKALLVEQPNRTDAALATIVATGRASLAEMRRLLGLARTEAHAELAPQPSLATLPELVDRVRDSGTPVDFRVTGDPAPLPATIELSAYRIVQEALTNTLKHATAGTVCTVQLDFVRGLAPGPDQQGAGQAPGPDQQGGDRPDGLRVRVHDTGEPARPPVPGNGLRGITERVHALGGHLRVGPAAGGGFEVSALLPVNGAEPALNAARPAPELG
jgi:signal transduction histidine kinase